MSNRVAIYARTSTGEQKLERQVRECMEALEAKPYVPTVVDEYRDEGLSGTDNDRESYRQLQEEISSGSYDLVIVTEISRLSRTGSEEVMRFISDCLEHECGVELVQSPLSLDVGDDELQQALGKIVASLLAELAAFEHKQMLERSYSGISAAQERGVWTGTPPRGFIQEEGEPLRVDLQEYLYVRRAVERVVEEGESKRSVAQETGIPRSTLQRYCNEEKYQQLYLHQMSYDSRLEGALGDSELTAD